MKEGMPLGAGSFVDDASYGDEDQNDLMDLIRKHKEEEPSMTVNERINKLDKDIECFKTAKEVATDALETAELELNAILDEEWRKSNDN